MIVPLEACSKPRCGFGIPDVFDVLTRRMNAAIGGDTEIERPYVDE